jgi:DNA-binding NarL/FixJ family response regulator
MPGRTGGERAAELQRRRPGLRFLFTSGYPAEAAVRMGLAEQSAAYIEKPFTAAAHAAAVGQALAA